MLSESLQTADSMKTLQPEVFMAGPDGRFSFGVWSFFEGESGPTTGVLEASKRSKIVFQMSRTE